MKVKVNLEKSIHFKKPTSEEVAQIRRSLFETESGLDELCYALVRGKSILPAIFDAETGMFVEQQVFLVDVDEGQSIKQSVEICKEFGVEPILIYRTFSGTNANQKHRLVFVTEDPIIDLDQRNQFQKSLIMLFHADIKTGDCKRIFFGGTQHIFIGGRPLSERQVLEIMNKEGEMTRNG